MGFPSMRRIVLGDQTAQFLGVGIPNSVSIDAIFLLPKPVM